MSDLNNPDDGLADLMAFIEPEPAATPEAVAADADAVAAELLGAPTPAPASAATAPAPAPAADPTPAPVAVAPTTQDRTTELLERLARAEAERSESVERERRATETRQREEEDRRRAQLYDPASLELTEEEQRTYAQSAPVINKLVRQELQRYHAQTLTPELGRVRELQQNIGNADSTARAALDRAVNATLRSAVPDLDNIARTPEWKAYLDEPMLELGGGVTRGSLLRTHLDNVNTDAAIHLIRGFTARGAGTPGTAPATAPPATPAPTPGRAGGGAPASVAAAARGATGKQDRYAYSQYAKIAEKASRGEVDLDKFDKLTDFYMRKMEEGLVDMDA